MTLVSPFHHLSRLLIAVEVHHKGCEIDPRHSLPSMRSIVSLFWSSETFHSLDDQNAKHKYEIPDAFAAPIVFEVFYVTRPDSRACVTQAR